MMNRVINIWADVICPFCYLGSVWAEQAARELQADLRWLPFEIHPDTPPEGAPKPFSPEEWPQVRARLERLAHCWSFWQSLRVIAPPLSRHGPSSSRAAARSWSDDLHQLDFVHNRIMVKEIERLRVRSPFWSEPG